MAALPTDGINGSGGIVEYLGFGLLCRQGDGMVGIMHHQFFAKGVDETTGAAGNGNLDRIELFNLHSVAQAITPQAVGCGDNQLIGAPLLDFPDGIDLGSLAFTLLNRQELIEHAHIEQQQHRPARPVALHREEALAGVVGVEEMHLAHVADCLILLPVRLKGNTPVEEDFQIGPHLMQTGFARFLEHLPEDDEKPRGHTAQVGHILSY